MSLLPKVQQEFAQTEYWDSFFKKRGKKAFEWYGEYLELCHQLHKYIKNKDRILVVGCGNSKLSMDLYDVGFKEITNIDVSHVAIKQMNELNKITRPDMKFIEMDATNMNFSDEDFSVVLDKGTLDALMPDNSDESRNTVIKYFKEIHRVLRNGGRYICISLLQEHILKLILEFFPASNFLLRLIRCFEAEQSNQEAVTMPVFVVVATKFKALPQPILELCLDGDKIQRVKSVDEILETIVSIQKAALVCNGLSKGNIAGHNEVQINLMRPGENTPRYTVFVIDQMPNSRNGRYAAFIVPQGREVEWLFSTPEGRKKLTESAKYNRLAIVVMNRDHNYTTLDEVKIELAECIRNLAPNDVKGQIPYLSLGSDVGERQIIANGSSEFSGEWTIEDVKLDNTWYRRLIFKNNQFVVQSEARLKIFRKEKPIRKEIDLSYLACQHHHFMILGAHLATIKNKPQNTGHTLVIGLGGGALCTFMHEILKNHKITAVEIDSNMVEIGKKYFGLKEDERLNIVVDDGLSFIQNEAEKESHYNAILFDVDSKDLSLGMSCPPKSFLELNILNAVKKLIKNDGIFVLNLVCRNNSLRNDIITNLQNIFKIVWCHKLEEDLNEIIYCKNYDNNFKENGKNLNNWKKQIEFCSKNLNQKVKDLEIMNDDFIDVKELMKNLKLQST